MPDPATKVREFVRSEFAARSEAVLDDDSNLIEAEILDSLGIFTTVGFLEDEFNIAIEPEDVSIENFRTLGAIVGLVERKLASS